jgi:transglutaminase-like putative cysteine protease
MAIRRLLLLIAALAALVGVAPLWPWLDLPLRLLLPVAFFLGLWADQRGTTLLAARPATLLIVVAFLWYAAHASRGDIVVPATNLLALLLALRLLTEKSSRHLLQIFILSLLALAASSLYSLSSAFLFFLVLEVLAIAFGLFLLCYAEADPQAQLERRPLQAVLAIGLGLPLVSLLLVPPLFFILPRTQVPLWNFLNQPQSGISGISDHVEPGTVSNLAQSRRIMLRVETLQQPRNELYWRVIVLNTPEGKAWVRRPPPAGEMNLPESQNGIEQRLYIEPTGDSFLPGLDPVVQWRGLRAERTPDSLVIAQTPLNQRSMVQATSGQGGRIRSGKAFPVEMYLTLPTEVTPRLRGVVNELIQEGDNARQRITAIEGFFLQQGLNYSLSDLPGGDYPLDNFLFEKKSGYCEHFAVAFATMLRLAKVPTRLVGGYYGGEYSELGGYYLVSEDRAHLWVEALVDGYWERIDPTLLARNAESVGNVQRQRMRGLSQWMDAFNYYWNRTVISYDLSQQIDWLRRTGKASRRWDFAAIFKQAIPMVVAPVVVLALLWLIIPRLRRSPEERLLQRFLRQLRKEQIATEDLSLGLHTLAARSRYPAAGIFAARYNAIIFSGRRASAAEIRELKALLRQMRN